MNPDCAPQRRAAQHCRVEQTSDRRAISFLSDCLVCQNPAPFSSCSTPFVPFVTCSGFDFSLWALARAHPTRVSASFLSLVDSTRLKQTHTHALFGRKTSVVVKILQQFHRLSIFRLLCSLAVLFRCSPRVCFEFAAREFTGRLLRTQQFMEPVTQMLFIKMGANAGLSEVGAITYWGLAAGSFCCGRFVTAFADYDFFICVSAAMIQCVNLNLPKRNQISPLINCNILVAACSGTGKTPLYNAVMGDSLDQFHAPLTQSYRIQVYHCI